MLCLLTTLLVFVTTVCADSAHIESPDMRFVKNIFAHAWEHREDLAEHVAQALDLSDQDLFDLVLDEPLPAPYISCPQCLTFVGGLQGLIGAGLTFDDVRDQAVEICLLVTVDMGYNGSIICDGMIDNFGPHVYYVLNVTDLDAREICEFHQACSPTNRSAGAASAFGEQRLPGLPEQKLSRRHTRREDMIKIAQITDVHYDYKYSTGSPTECDLPLCCRDYWEGTGVAGEWGDYSCAVPAKTVDVMLQFMATLQPDMVINTGDTPNHALWEETQMGQIEYNRWLAEAIEQYMPQAEGYFCIGNHDTYPTNLYFAERPQIQALNRNFTEMFARLTNWTDEARETMEYAGYYVMEIRPGLKVMAINSNYGYTDNFYGVLIPDSPEWQEHTEYIENAFLEARQNGDKIILLGHHTIGSGFDFYVGWINLMLETYGDVIVFQLQGHSHRDRLQLSSDENLDATSAMFICSSMATSPNRNPTFRVYYLDPATYLPLEWDHYYINLTATQHGVTPVVELMYNTREEYGMEDLTVQSCRDMIDRMVTDDDLYYAYKWNEASRVVGKEPDSCTGNCRQKQACDMRTSSSERYDQCMEQW